jgi:ParB-like chromosome segregation protein Spo0J
MSSPSRPTQVATPCCGVDTVVHQVQIESLLIAETPRSRGLDADHVAALSEARSELPPIVVHRQSMRVIDGAHRVAAARMAGQTAIAARFFDGTLADAFKLAVEQNVGHGLPLSLDDRRAAAERILQSHPHLSDRAVARSTGLAPGTVAALRCRQDCDAAGFSVSRLGSDGKTRPLTTADGRMLAARILAERPDTPLRQIAAQASISVGTAHDVKTRLLAGRSPLPSGSESNTSPRPPEHRSDEASAALVRLRREPALRYSAAGRDCLQWLGRSVTASGQWRGALDIVPSHCRPSVAEIARECARAWNTIADECTRPRS